MIKVDTVVKRETKYIMLFSLSLSLLLQLIFILLQKWNYTVILGNLFSLAVAVLNFYFMGLSVQKAVSMDEPDARKIMRSSQGIRNIFLFICLAFGVLIPIFNTISVIVPAFFPRIAVSFRPLFKNRKDVING